ncbi:cytochrome P450 [Cladochytrium replicatum]|nr:cytochrome P450 [Cladochytrium replicatum]
MRLMLTDVDALYDLLSPRMQDSQVKGKAYDAAWPLIGDGILAISGPSWKAHRKVIDNGFRLENLRSGAKMMKAPIDRLIKRWTSNPDQYQTKSFDMIEETLRLTMDVICQVGFSRDFEDTSGKLYEQQAKKYLGDSEESKRLLYQVFADVNERVARLANSPLWWRHVPTPKMLALKRDLAVLDGVVSTMINEKVASLTSGDQSSHGVFLDSFVALDSEGNLVMTEKEVMDEVKTLMFAGHDTTGITLSWAFYELSQHPEIIKGLLSEIGQTFPGWEDRVRADGLPPFPEYDTLNRMPYLNGFINEVLRIHPPAGFMRTITKEIVLNGTRIAPETSILLLPHLFHLNPDYFEEPEKIYPERWIDEDQPIPEGVARRSLFMERRAFHPFSLGQRNCVGMKLAQAELRASILRLVQMFEFEYTAEKEPSVVIDLTVAPVEVQMKVRPRKFYL